VSACGAQCPEVVDPTCKPAADSLPFEIDLFDYVAVRWQPNRQYSNGAKVHPPVPNGFVLEADGPGTSGGELPPYDPVAGEIISDGSMTWELVAATEDDISDASDPDATVDPQDSGGLAVADLTIANGRFLRGTYVGGVAGEAYEVAFEFTVDGLPRGFTQKVTVS
jgi:hypothetical protein